MRRAVAEITALADDLRGLLDEEIALLDLRKSQLEAVSEAILKRNNDGLERLSEEMDQTQRRQSATDARLRALRGSFAAAMSLDPARVKLSALIGQLPEALRGGLESRRQRLIALAERIRRRHLEVAMLLWECARINRLLLESLLPGSETVTTYGAGGADSWKPDTGLMDAEF